MPLVFLPIFYFPFALLAASCPPRLTNRRAGAPLCETRLLPLGFLPENRELYNFLQSVGFILIFKPVLELKSGKVKGNVDAELVLQVMIDYGNYHQAIIVTGDGDFYCLVKHLMNHDKLAKVLAPSPKNCSSLLKKVAKDKIAMVCDLQKKLIYKKSTS
jgi:hypothetical protein